MTDLGDRARAAQRAARRFDQQVAGGVRVTILDDSPGRDAGFDRVFVGLGATLDAMPDILRTVGAAAAREEFRGNFARQAGRAAWAPLAPSTVRDRIRRGYPGARPILKRTGALERHVTTAPAKVTRAGDTITLTIDPRPGMRKYVWHAQGTRRMPARPMVVLTPAASARVTSALSREMRTRARANGVG